MMAQQRIGTPNTSFVRIEGNVPIPVYAPIPTAKLINDMTFAAMSAEYEPMKDIGGEIREEEKQFIGWTCLEVMTWRRAQAAAQGDLDSHKMMLDRTLGKSVQQITQTNINVTLSEALSNMADRISARRPGLLEQKMHVLDVTATLKEQETAKLSDIW